MEHHSTNLQASRPSLLRRSRATLPRTTYLGSRHRPKTWGPYYAPRKNLLPYRSRTGRAEKVRHRTFPKGLHSPVQEPLRRPLLFHQKERWKTPTRPRLPTAKSVDSSEHVPPPIDSSTH